ncbi:hypothetical protein [Taylorella equigenitalis]|uniref:YkuD domain-containing protein n=1 Tax=Taylorella equigenitalis ATCC 35865 TaxID=743973 RepID=A0ABN4ATP0_9BURK|nr:hypothetical protein [Taylorella equigenitalis]AFN35212.1 hypothetical protein KUI_0109 [Taylorella equigenitalis ATCC 35865]WDU54967.1 hypothetical protein KPZ19_00665 [Taylorella equigenitalis]
MVYKGIDCFKHSDDGFWRVKLNSHLEVSVPSYTRVILGEIKNERRFFSFYEGLYKNQEASISLKNGDPFMGRMLNYRENVNLVLNLNVSASSKEEKQIHGILVTPIGNLHCKSWGRPYHPGFQIILDSIYRIKFPDYPHKGSTTYNTDTHLYKVWFGLELLIGSENITDRYLHFGQTSHGCVSCSGGELWTSLCEYLLTSRVKNNFDTVGFLKVNYI